MRSKKEIIKFIVYTTIFVPITIFILEITFLFINKANIVNKTQTSMIEVPIEQIKTIPALLGEVDIIKAIQLLPGVQSSEGTSGLYVRGGGPDQNLILLDGVPVYNASHLFGFFSVFNSDAINSTKLVKGGFPARYGGRLSSVIDIKMKEGNMKKFHGQGSIGLISSKLSLEGPIIKDKTSFIVSARRTYLDVIARPFVRAYQRNQAAKGNGNEGSSNNGGYYFYDLNGKINHKISEKHRLYFSHYMGRDRAFLDAIDNYSYDTVVGVDTINSQLGWGNVISALRWNYMPSNKMFINTTLRYSKYDFLVAFGFNQTETTPSTTRNSNFSYAYISNIEDWLSKDHSSIYPIGRNGMHRYNNQDHSMMTAVKSVRNILLGETNDIWKINVEDDYHEEINTGRSAPIQKE